MESPRIVPTAIYRGKSQEKWQLKEELCQIVQEAWTPGARAGPVRLQIATSGGFGDRQRAIIRRILPYCAPQDHCAAAPRATKTATRVSPIALLPADVTAFMTQAN